MQTLLILTFDTATFLLKEYCIPFSSSGWRMADQPVRVLLLEDLETDAKLEIHELDKTGIRFEWIRVDTSEGFRRALEDFRPHIILADYSLPHYDGRSALTTVRATDPELPFIFVTGTMGEELAIDLLRDGATDYILKNRLGRLGPAFQRALRESEERMRREEAEQLHRAALDRYRQVVENANDVIFATDRIGNFTFCNQAGIRMSGYSMGELWKLNYLDLVLPEHRERLKKHLMKQVISRTPSTAVEFPFRTKSGEVKWFSMNASLVEEQGEYEGFHAIARDISKRKAAEAALKESEQRFRLMVDGITTYAIYMLDPTGHVVSWNKGATRLRGYREDEALGRSFATFFSQPDVEKGVPQALLRTAELEGQVRYEGWVLHKNRTMFHADKLITAIRNDLGRLTGYAVLTRDTTEQKRFAESLTQSEERFRRLFRSNPAAVAIGKRDTGILVDVNDRYCEILGYTREELVGKSALDLKVYADPGERARLLDHIASGKPVYNIETMLRRKDGVSRNVLLSMEIIDLLGEAMLVSMFVDNTERKQTQLALERSEEEYRRSSEQLRALAARLQSAREDEQTRIAREIHDELGQSLTGLKMDLVWIEKKWKEGDTAMIGAILERIRIMSGLIDETIRMVRRISSELRPGVLDDLGLVAALEWQLHEFSERTSIKGTFRSEADSYTLDRDRTTALFRIFQESLTNIARHSAADRIKVSLGLEKDHLVLEVTDNGRGISEADMARKSSLGLLGMRERALVLNGSVHITGKPGKGTTVTVRIPLEGGSGSD